MLPAMPPELARAVYAALGDGPWRAGELGRLVASALGPLGIHLASHKNAGAVYAFLGVLAAFLGLFAGLQWVNRRRNRAELELQTLPGRIGGRFAAIATIPEAFDPGTGVRVTLRCVLTQSTAVGSGNTDDAVSVLTDTRNARRRSDSSTSTVFEDTRLASLRIRRADEGELREIAFEVPVFGSGPLG
jgi:hypothetical protein